ncbi:hypothetical protein PVAND_014691 [Polypedilum vanderplanki]|uniref:Alpha 1,4-glycosyltransferase domain-containing protein n=1 Tax=Polypedilum vanderplanki TaxID=319348 RepID=A0A9J6BA38_POLVA|nr:hypothetical protein PVAND_014691 [Polypedilum vanderplanki]
MWKNIRKKRNLLIPISILALIFTFLNFKSFFDKCSKNLQIKKENFENYKSDESFILQNFLIDLEKLENPKSKQIFFLETHLFGKRKLENSRQICSIESAARMNHDFNIYFFLMTDQNEVILEHTIQLDVLLSYSNIKIRFANITEFTKGTKMENFFKENKIAKSPYQIEHTSDILRMLILNKFGGLYLDHDVLSLFPISLLNVKNFGCLEKRNFFANAILKLDKIEGKKYSDLYLEKVANHYDPNSWPANGPVLVTQSFRSFCNNTNLERNKTTKCDKITALANEKCFLFMWHEYEKFYEEKFLNEGLERMMKIGAFFVHIWNHSLKYYNKIYKLTRDSKVVYMELAKAYCPRTIEIINTF